MTHDVITALAALGLLGQILAGASVLAGVVWLAGFDRPLTALREGIWGYELWLAFLASALATGGSLFFSEVAGFVPCELCWYQRICMYPLSIATLLIALANDHRAARYLLPLPIVGAGVAAYHLLVENGAIKQTQACPLSAPGGCATKWINEFGFISIPTLALTAFALTFVFLGFGALESGSAARNGDRDLGAADVALVGADG